MKTLTVAFFGPQGSGKGTQAAKLVQYLKETDDKPVVDLETGRGFRALKESSSFTAARVREILENGELVPNFLTSSIVMMEIAERITADSHLIIDGFPRNSDQARVLEQMMDFYKRDHLTVIGLDVSEAVVIERLTGRGREDDTPELIAERLRLYQDQTKPLIDYYENRPRTTFYHIDGTKSADEVATEIQSKIIR